MIEGEAIYVADGEVIEAEADNLIVVPAGIVHSFENTGDKPLRQIDIHATDRIVTHWIDSSDQER